MNEWMNEMKRGLLNSLLGDNIKSAKVSMWGRGEQLWIYNCFLTHWPNFAAPVSERWWLTAVRVCEHCRSFWAFGFHSDASMKAIYCILRIPGVCTLLNYNYNSNWDYCPSAASYLIHFNSLSLFFLPFPPKERNECISLFFKMSSAGRHGDKEWKSCVQWIIDEWPHPLSIIKVQQSWYKVRVRSYFRHEASGGGKLWQFFTRFSSQCMAWITNFQIWTTE